MIVTCKTPSEEVYYATCIVNPGPRVPTGEKSQEDDYNGRWRRESDVPVAR